MQRPLDYVNGTVSVGEYWQHREAGGVTPRTSCLSLPGFKVVEATSHKPQQVAVRGFMLFFPC